MCLVQISERDELEKLFLDKQNTFDLQRSKNEVCFEGKSHLNSKQEKHLQWKDDSTSRNNTNPVRSRQKHHIKHLDLQTFLNKEAFIGEVEMSLSFLVSSLTYDLYFPLSENRREAFHVLHILQAFIVKARELGLPELQISCTTGLF